MAKTSKSKEVDKKEFESGEDGANDEIPGDGRRGASAIESKRPSKAISEAKSESQPLSKHSERKSAQKTGATSDYAAQVSRFC